MVDFVSSIICSVKNYGCHNDLCENCPGRKMLAYINEFLKTSDNITYSKWVRKDCLQHKIEISASGQLVAESIDEIGTKLNKLHMYNIFRQYSELKHLKKNLVEDEVLLVWIITKN